MATAPERRGAVDPRHSMDAGVPRPAVFRRCGKGSHAGVVPQQRSALALAAVLSAFSGAKILWSNTLAEFQHSVLRSVQSARICGVILEDYPGRPRYGCKPLQNWFCMTQSISTGAPAGPETIAGPPASGAEEAAASPMLPQERSRFSSWLASFGLGETTIPLLRPLRTPRSGR